MNKRSITVLFAAAALTAGAQSKLDQQSLWRLQDLREQVETTAKKKGVSAKSMEAQQNIEVFVKMNDGVSAAELSGMGFNVEAQRGEFAVVSLPVGNIMELNDVADVKSMSYGRKVKLRLTEANKQTGVDEVHSGVGDDKTPYTGKGVIIGDIDMGFDLNHLMFLDKDGKSRFKYYTAQNIVYNTPERIAAYTTDSRSDTHATHVMGIAGGNFESENYSISGVATEADLAGASIDGYETEIIKAIENFVAYAKEKQQPLVINMSLGDNFGPHDDSDAMSQYINKVIDDKAAVICMASGNEGNNPIVQRKTFESTTDEMRANLFCIHQYYGYSYEMPSVYFKSEKPFTFSLVIYDNLSKKIIKQYDPITGPTIKTYQSSGLKADPDYSQYFSGTLRISADNVKDKGYYYLQIASQSFQRKNTNVTIGYIVTGDEGQSVVAYADEATYLVDSFTSSLYGSPDYTAAKDVTFDGTVSNMASGTKAIIVGSYNSRDKGKYSNNQSYSLYMQGETNVLGDVSSFTSWGTIDGVSLPDISAPGCLVESAINTYYQQSHREAYTKGVYYNGKTYYWSIEAGTSMATPYMSGVAALWLEADPTLSNDDIKKIAKETAITDDFVKNTKYPVQFGAGKIDAYNGLKYVLDHKATALKTVDADKDMMFRQTGDNTYEAYVAGETAITVRLFDMSGSLVKESRSAGNTARFSVAGMPKGIYAVELCGAKTSHKIKVVVK